MSGHAFPVAVHESWEWTGAGEDALATLRAGAMAGLESAELGEARVEAAAFVGISGAPGLRAVIAGPDDTSGTLVCALGWGDGRDPGGAAADKARQGAERVARSLA